MKKNDFMEIKKLDIAGLRAQTLKIKKELADLVLDKNLNKLKDVKIIAKKKKERAQILTVLRQKELLEMMAILEKATEGAK